MPRRPGIRASPGTRTGASSSCSARSRWAFPTRPSTHAMAAIKRKHRRRARRRPDGATRCEELAAGVPRRLPRAHRRSRFPPIPTSSSSARSRRCSGRGTASAPSITGASSGSRRTWPTAPRSTSARWCSATWATTRRPASASPAIRAPARTSSTASTWSTRRARTSSPASARPSRSRRWRRRCPELLPAARRAARQARGALPGGAGLRVHDRARPPLLPADPQRQDERAGDGDDLGRDVRRGADREGPGADPHQPDAARAAARAARSTPRTRRGRSRRACRRRPAPRRAASCSTRTRPSERGKQRRQGDPRARGDQARGHPRLLRRAGRS